MKKIFLIVLLVLGRTIAAQRIVPFTVVKQSATGSYTTTVFTDSSSMKTITKKEYPPVSLLNYDDGFSENIIRVKDLFGHYRYLYNNGIEMYWWSRDGFGTDAGNFHEGFARVWDSEKKAYGYINKKGDWVIYPHFQKAADFHEGLAAVVVDDGSPYSRKLWGFIDSTDKLIDLNNSYTHFSFDSTGSFKEGIVRVELFKKWGFMDKTGKIVINKDFDIAHDFQNDLALVAIQKKYGFINKKGTRVIPLKYDYATDFCEGVATVSSNRKFGCIDKTGKVIVPIKYDTCYSFAEGLVGVKLNGLWGFVDKTGKIVVPIKYDEIMPFSNGFAAVSSGAMWGFINKTGKEVIPLQYDEVMSFSEGLAAVTGKSDLSWGFIDTTGREITPIKYSIVKSFKNGLAMVTGNDYISFYIDKAGREYIKR
jgi:hypothetical protein